MKNSTLSTLEMQLTLHITPINPHPPNQQQTIPQHQKPVPIVSNNDN